jgi:hypothetical protein
MLLFLVPYQAIMSFFGQGNTEAGEINGTSISQEEFRNSLTARENLESIELIRELNAIMRSMFKKREVVVRKVRTTVKRIIKSMS